MGGWGGGYGTKQLKDDKASGKAEQHLSLSPASVHRAVTPLTNDLSETENILGETLF